MAAQDRNTLKAWFEKGDKPLQQQFADLIDSFLLITESIAPEKVEGLAQLLIDKSDKGHLHTGNIDFSAIAFDNTGVSADIVESEYSFSTDANFIYIKRPDNHWVRSKIHKEATVADLGSLPE
jgi:hypothetical protein